MPFTALLSRFHEALPHAEKINTRVSSRGVDWHLEHTLKSINIIAAELVRSKPNDFKPKFNLAKYYVMLTESMPRGRGVAPRFVDNREQVDISTLNNLYEDAKISLASIQNLKPKQHFKHHRFGELNLKQTKKFLLIHSNHHLDIIDDIINKN